MLKPNSGHSSGGFLKILLGLFFIFALSVASAAQAADLKFEFSRGPTGGTIGQLNTVGDDVCPNTGVSGCDFSQADDFVRTNDGVGYNFAIQVDPPGDNVFIDTTLKPGMVWDQLPGSCNPLTSFITGDGTAGSPSRLYCDLGFKSSFAANLVFVARALGDNPNGATSGIASAEFGGDNSTTIVADTTVAQDVTITSKPQYNVRKARHSSAPITLGGVAGYQIRYQLWVDTWKTDTNGNTADDPDPLFGNELAVGPITFTEDARSVSPNAYIVNCSQPGSSLFPSRVFDSANPERSVLNAGTISCASTGPGVQTTTVTITGADLSLSHYPTETRTGRALPGDRRVASFGMVDVFIPISDINDAGGELATENFYTDFSPSSITGQSNFQGAPQDAGGGESDEDNNVPFTVREGSGSFSHTYRCYINGGTPVDGCSMWWSGPTSASGVGSGDGPAEASQEFASYTFYRNGSFSNAEDVSVCAVFDSRYYEPELYNASQAVRCVGQCGTLGVDYVIEYANGYASTAWQDAATVPSDAVPNECSVPDGSWNTSFAAASAAGDVTKARIRRLTPLNPGQVHAMTTRLRAKPLAELTGVPNGTLLKTWGTVSSSLFFPGYRPCGYTSGAWETPQHTTNGCGDRVFYSGSLARMEKRTVPNNLINTIDAGGKVTFELFPSFTSLNTITDNVTIVDTLPVGGIYVPGTARQGGVPSEPVITGDVSSGQILTWDLGTLSSNVPIDTITFDMRTPLQTPNGTTLDNTARIDAASDGSSPEQRGAVRRVTVTAPASMLMAKEVAQALVPQDSAIDYTVEYLNTTSSSFFEMDIIDVFPYDEDSRFPPSDFSGTNGLISVTPQSTSAQFYFTRDNPASVQMDPNITGTNDLATGSTNWCPATPLHTVNPAASPSNGSGGLCPTTPEQVTALRIVDTQELESAGIRNFQFQMSTSGNFGGDLYVNQAQGTSDGISLSPQTPFVETRIFELPQIGLAKENVDVTDGVVTLRFRVENLGNTPFSGVSLIDDLDATFGAGTYEIDTAPTIVTADVGAGIVVDPAFTGTGGQTNILDASSTLGPLEFAIIELKVLVNELTDQGNGVGVYENTSTVSGTTPSGSIVTDVSNDGADPDLNDDGDAIDPNEDTPTPISIPVVQGIEVVKSSSTALLSSPIVVGDNIEYTFVIENTGNVTLPDVTLTDPLFTPNDITSTCTFPLTTGVLKPNETANCTALYAIKGPDIDNVGVTNQAVAAGTGPNGAISDDSDSGNGYDDTGADDDQTTTPLPVPSLQVVKTDVESFSTPVAEGDTIAYSITVENTGNLPLTSVTLADTLTNADGAALSYDAPGLTWVSADGGSGAGALEVDETATYTATYTLTQADINSGGITNTARATGTDPNGTVVSDVSDDPSEAADADTNGNGDPDDPNVSTFPPVPGISLTKAGDTSAFQSPVQAGDIITYTFVATNTGNVTLDTVAISDDGLTNSDATALTLTTSPTWQDPADGSVEGTLEPGATATYTATYALTQDDINSGGIENTATASGDDPNGTTVEDVSDDPADTENVDPNGDSNPDDPVTTLIAPAPGIVVQKTDDLSALSTPVSANDVITYEITVQNTGNVTLNNLALTDALTNDDGDTYDLSAAIVFQSSDQGSAEGDLLVGEIATYALEYTLTQDDVDSGAVENVVTATATDPNMTVVEDVSDDPDAGNSSEMDPTRTPFAPEGMMDVVKTADTSAFSDPVAEGDIITYSINVKNTGNVTLSNIVLTDTLTNNNGTSVDLSTDINFVSADQSSVEGTLLVGETATYTLDYSVTQEDIDYGGVSNTVEVDATDPVGTLVEDTSDDPASLPGTDDPTVVPLDIIPALNVLKTADISNLSTPAVPGEVIDYEITVQNTGNVTLNAVALSDTLTDGLGNAQVLTTSFASASLSSAEGTLLVGETATYTAQFTLTQDVINTGGISNAATATGTSPTGVPVEDVSDDPADTTDADPNGDGNPDDPTVTSLAVPSISVLKQADTTALQTPPAEGDQITYTVTVANTGNVPLNSVALVDSMTNEDGIATDLSANVTFNSASLGSGEGTLLVSETATYQLIYALTQADIDSGGVTNSVTSNANDPSGTPVTDVSDDPTDGTNVDENGDGEPDDPTVTPLTRTPAIALTKTDDISALQAPVRAGDVLSYVFEVTNTGNVTLSTVSISDNSLTNGDGTVLSLTSGPDFQSADQGSADGTLKVGEVATYTATYALTQDDVNSQSIINSATAQGNGPGTTGTVQDLSDDPEDTTDADTNGNGTPDDPTLTELPSAPDLVVNKSISDVVQVFPFVYDVTYSIDVTNTGNGTAFNVQVIEDLANAMAPGTVVGVPTVVLSGFTGAGTFSPDFDGVTDTDVMAADVVLQPTESGNIELVVRVNFVAGLTTQTNTAYGTADGITTPVASDDPTVTPDDATDVNPTPPPVVDEDLDGSPDGSEGTGDRDGDGIVDNQDYDPLGYFYCEETGDILTGGRITVTGPLGSQSGVGTSNNITIVTDGADGSYQWFVSAAGLYTMSYDLPTTGVASTERLAGGVIDVTSFLPQNPVSLGGSEVGASGVLSDFSVTGNPFFVEFNIEENDPTILNNNIPLRFCGLPVVSATKEVIGETIVRGDQRLQLTYDLTVENTGDTRVVDPTLVDNLDAVFGAGNHEVLSLSLEQAPATFGTTENANFDGSANPNLLASGGILEPTESATVRMTIAVTIEQAATFTNVVVAGGSSPLDGTPIVEATDEVDLDLAPPPRRVIEVTKSAGVATARLGDQVPYTISYFNALPEDLVDVVLVDQLPEGFAYRTGSAQINGVAVEPGIFGRRLTWVGQDIPTGETLILELSATVGPRADAQEFSNTAWAEDPITGERISTVGEAIVKREIEAIFDCSDIIGTVFDDLNHNGYQDGPYDPTRGRITDQSVYASKYGKLDITNDPDFKGEPGLAGVRLSTTTGTLITTDQYGRYHVPCAALPGRMGQNFTLKLDTRTLPSGYRVTTENPRSLRVTAGKFAKINFGASISRVVDIDLSSRAFVTDSDDPKPSLVSGISGLLDQIEDTPSVLRLSYFKNGEDRRRIKNRVDNIEDMIRDQWKRRDTRYKLVIERTIKRLQ